MDPGAVACAKVSRKRKSTGTAAPSNIDVIDLTGDDPTPAPKRTPRAKKQRREESNPPVTPEHRLRRFRAYPPASCMDRLRRSRTQRMYVVGHTVGGTSNMPEISFDMVGTTGNLYKTVIGKVPSCDCPDAMKGNQCKHIFYVLVNALKAPEHLQYQLAFLSEEVREMYHGSPLRRGQAASTEDTGGKQRPIEGDCPICFMEFEANEAIVFCRAACGNNIHKACFDQWAATTRASGVRCVYCRAPWKSNKPDHDLESLKKDGRVNEEGYLNVAEQFGLSGEREWSSYSRWFTSRPRASSQYDEYGLRC
ncbi:uncharacterized protein PFLUO_LOCUS8232 [Penicillium psychrofluorescens]|uniref:uncharacterized protein n=1 Tax=Penicillium psychrofluorescens TaxID=3158075 RepID=UPI003CCD8A9E